MSGSCYQISLLLVRGYCTVNVASETCSRSESRPALKGIAFLPVFYSVLRLELGENSFNMEIVHKQSLQDKNKSQR